MAGRRYNINADLVAGEVAAALQAEKLIHLTDVEGIKGPGGDLISTLCRRARRAGWSAAGVIEGGMLPKVESALRAPGGRDGQGPHPGRPHPARDPAGDLHPGGHRHRDRPVASGERARDQRRRPGVPSAGTSRGSEARRDRRTAVTDVDLRERLIIGALRIRMVEERVIALYPSDRIQSPVHLGIGQEALAVGACHALRPADLLFATYRSHAFYLAKGGDLSRLFAELFGRRDGCARGKGGSMHLAAPEVGFMGTSAIVSSTIRPAVGAALAAERLAKDQVVVAAFGDGATEEGAYHESLNFAALHRLPVLFLCDNNGLAVHSPLASRQAYRIAEHAGT